MPLFHTILVGNKVKITNCSNLHLKENGKHGKKDLFNPEYFLWALRDVD
jgi:hypothetical protein